MISQCGSPTEHKKIKPVWYTIIRVANVNVEKVVNLPTKYREQATLWFPFVIVIY
jgi:hypothetical protein